MDESVAKEAERIKKEKSDKKLDSDKDFFSKINKFEKINSIYTVSESFSAKLKDFVEELVECESSGKPSHSDQNVIKTLFVYFFELLGVQKEADLKTLTTNVI